METAAANLLIAYGPWGGVLVLGVLYAMSLLKRANEQKTSDAVHQKEVDTLKSEYQKQREDAERRFQEFKELYRQQREESHARFEAVVGMYEKNVELVEDYKGMARDLMATVSLVSERLKESNAIAMNNLFCPMQRIQETITRKTEIGPKL